MNEKSEQLNPLNVEKSMVNLYRHLEYSSNEKSILENLAKVPTLDMNYSRYAPPLIELLAKFGNETIWRAAYPKFPREQKLFVAASFGWHHTVAHLIRQRADVNLKSQSGATALYYAAQFGHLKCVRRLLAAGAQINPKTVLYELIADKKEAAVSVRINQKGVDPAIISPLCAATQGRHYEVMEFLLKYGADVEQLSPYGFAYEHQLYDATYACELRSAPNESHPYSAMHIAAANDDIKALGLLLNYGACVDHAATFEELGCCGLLVTLHYASTPLNTALAHNSLAAVKFLLEQGADVNHVAQDKLPYQYPTGELNDYHVGTSPLHIAVQQCGVDTVDNLLNQGAQINTPLRRPDGFIYPYSNAERTPLDLAFSKNENAKVIAQLMRRGARLSDWDYYFALALERKDLPAIKLLLAYRPQEKHDLSVFLPRVIKGNLVDVLPILFDHGIRINAKHIKLAQDYGSNEVEKLLSDAAQKQEAPNRFKWFTPRNASTSVPVQQASTAPR